MPELVINNVEVFLNQQERKLYDTLQREMVLQLPNGIIDASNAGILSEKLLQMASGAVYDADGQVLRIHNRKLDALEDLVEAANGQPLLVAYWYKHDLVRIQERFDARVLDTSQDIADWNAGRISIGLVHPASAGHGLNMQEGGSTIVWFSLKWSLELYMQLNARLWRQGQNSRTVIVHRIIVADTHDEDVVHSLERKDMGQASLVTAVKARLGGQHEQAD